MKINHRVIKIFTAVFIYLIIIIVSIPARAQETDTTKTTVQISTGDTIKAIPSSPQKMFSEIARQLKEQQQFLTISYENPKVQCSIEDSATLFKVPGGESPAILFELPDFVNDYILTIKSKWHGLGFKIKMFAPTCVFLDSSFRPTHFLSEKKFQFVQPNNFKGMHIATEVIIDNERKEDKYLLIYTSDKTERLYTYSDNSQGALIALLKHPVIRSPQGRIELNLHLR